MLIGADGTAADCGWQHAADALARLRRTRIKSPQHPDTMH